MRPLFVLFLTLGTTAGPALGQEAEKRTLRVAGVVLKWVQGDKDANWRRAEPLIREAAKKGAELVVTAETFLDGHAAIDKRISLETLRTLGELIPDGAYYKRL